MTSERQASPPRMTRVSYTLHLQTDEPAQRVDLLHRNIKKFGTIYNTLAAICDVDGEIIVESPQKVQTWAAERCNVRTSVRRSSGWHRFNREHCRRPHR